VAGGAAIPAVASSISSAPTRRDLIAALVDETHYLLHDDDGFLFACDSELVTEEYAECVCEKHVHTYSYWCACPQEGCWNDHLSFYIRDDVTCQPNGVRVGEYNGVIKIGDWCWYHQPVPWDIYVEGIPDGAMVIEPGIGPAVLCVPQCSVAPFSVCECETCLPAGGGDCPCRCDGACWEFRRRVSPTCVEICCTPKLTAPPNTPSYHYRHTIFHRFTSLAGLNWCATNGCINRLPENGCIVRDETRWLGALLTWGECDATWELWSEVRERTPLPGCLADEGHLCDQPLVPQGPRLIDTFSLSQVLGSLVESETGDWLFQNPSFCGCGPTGAFRETYVRNPACFEVETLFRDTLTNSACGPDGVTCGCLELYVEEITRGWSWSPPGDPSGCCRGCREDVCDDPEVNDGGGCTNLPTSPNVGAGSYV